MKSSYTEYQPVPREGTSEVMPHVHAALDERYRFGVRKHGRPLRMFDGREADIDAAQEALDLVQYLLKATEELSVLAGPGLSDGCVNLQLHDYTFKLQLCGERTDTVIKVAEAIERACARTWTVNLIEYDTLQIKAPASCGKPAVLAAEMVDIIRHVLNKPNHNGEEQHRT